MKNFLIVAGLLGTVAATAQNSEGRIVYEQKINVHKRMPPEAEQFKAMVPEFTTTKMELSFKGDQSLYKAVKTDEDEMPSTDGGGGRGGGFGMFRAMMNGGNSESFKDYNTGIATETRELGPKKYLLDDTLRRLSWKLSSDTMTILGHLCHKATAVQKGGIMGMMQQRMGGGGNRPQGQGANGSGTGDTTRRRSWMNNSDLAKDQQVVAWYADDLASPAGPENYYGLPGVILQLNLDDGLVVYTPLEISPAAGTVKAPTSGKKITREEYRKMMQEQAQMMGGGNRGGGGGFRMGGPM